MQCHVHNWVHSIALHRRVVPCLRIPQCSCFRVWPRPRIACKTRFVLQQSQNCRDRRDHTKPFLRIMTTHAPTLCVHQFPPPQAPTVLDRDMRWASQRSHDRITFVTHQICRYAWPITCIVDGVVVGTSLYECTHTFCTLWARVRPMSEHSNGWGDAYISTSRANTSSHTFFPCALSITLRRHVVQSCPKVVLRLHPVSPETRRARPLSEWVCATPSADHCQLGLVEGKTVRLAPCKCVISLP